MMAWLLASVLVHSYDVKFYWLNLTLDPEGDSIWGFVEIGAEPRWAFDSFEVHLDPYFTIDSVLLGGSPVYYTRDSDTLWVHASPDTTFSLRVYYHGKPHRGLYFDYWGVFSSNLGPTSLHDAHGWFPCYDTLGDKADSAWLWFTVPDGWIAASNGTLEGIDTLSGWLRYRWRERHPIAVYLISVAASDKYTPFRDTWRGLPLEFYPFGIDSTEMAEDVQRLGEVLALFDSLFGPYPFSDEKFGYAEARIWGGAASLEHQTLVSMGSYFIAGGGKYLDTYAHELAHQWWADWVTALTWRHVWLHEGFASYAEVLFAEGLFGPDSARKTLETFKNLYFQEDARARFPIYDPPIDYIWGYTVYKKGAWVLHMLRWVLGDSLFFASLGEYRARYGGSNATIDEFRAVCEEVSGRDLGWFFDEWIYQAGYPILAWDWFSRGDTVTVLLRQVQEDAPVFRMPIEIEFRGADTLRDTVWFNELAERWQWVLGFEPQEVVLDPDMRVLHDQVPLQLAEGGAAACGLRLLGSVVSSEIRLKADFKGEFAVFDMAGRRVLSGQFRPGLNSVPVAGLRPGVYALRATAPSGPMTLKFVKRRKD